jgi:hypothetical protein
VTHPNDIWQRRERMSRKAVLAIFAGAAFFAAIVVLAP